MEVGPRPALEVQVAESGPAFADFRELLAEYFAHLELTWPYPDPARWRRELNSLPGNFAPPSGRMLVAYVEAEPAGVVALVDLGDGSCEVKRLYVRPSHRRQGVSRALMERLLAEAHEAGYARMCLGTAPSFAEAIALYESLGFRPITRFREGFGGDSVFLEAELG